MLVRLFLVYQRCSLPLLKCKTMGNSHPIIKGQTDRWGVITPATLSMGPSRGGWREYTAEKLTP